MHRASKVLRSSIILSHVGVGPIEQVVIGVKLILSEGIAERHLELTFTLVRVLPAGEMHNPHDFIN